MIIGIDARFFGPRAKGLGRYTQKLVENLEKIDLENQYVIFLRPENFNDFIPQNPNFRKVLAPWKWYSFKEQLFFPFAIRRAKVDLMHFPHFNAPLFYFGEFVVTIHDLILRYFPPRRNGFWNGIIYWFKNLAYEMVIFRALARAKKVIAVSQYVKKDILEHFKIKEEKIEVVLEGAPEESLKPALSEAEGLKVYPEQSRRRESEKLIKDKFKIAKPYLFYVGNAYPHKNLENLIRAFEILVKEYGLNLQLVLAGEEDYFWRRLKKQSNTSILRSMEVLERIVFTGFLTEEELEEFYRQTTLYVFPSFCEGFGLPPLEAMARGAPVVSSDSTALPEILGEAAVYFDPGNPKDMAEKIHQVLSNDDLRKKLVEKGFERIKKYSWEKMAREIKEIYDGTF